MHQTTLFSSIGVTTCELAKTTCRNCDLNIGSFPCLSNTRQPYSQEECYNAVDGITNVMAEYRVERTECHLISCDFTAVSYMDLRVVIMMACASGTCI